MLGDLDPSKRKMFIVGGGISGLLCAWRFARAGYPTTVVEAQARWGGLIQTHQLEHGIAETALHSFLESPLVHQFLEELRFDRVEVRKNSRARFIVRAGQPRRLPLRPHELLLLATRYVFTSFPHTPADEMTLKEWGDGRLGAAGTAYLLNPFLRGIYAARPEELGVQACFPDLLRKPKKNKKLIGPRRMIAGRLGSESLIRTLVERIQETKNAALRLSTQIETLPSDANVIMTAPAYAAADILKTSHPQISELLASIRYVPLVTITVFVEAASIAPSRGVGIGALFPEAENSRTLGILFNSSAFENRVRDETSAAAYTVLLGGSAQPEVMAETDTELLVRVDHDLRVVLGSGVRRLSAKITRWPRALPLYSNRLASTWSALSSELKNAPGLLLFGNYTGQISLRGMIETVMALPLLPTP